MKTFPETECYLIMGDPGAGTHLVRNLIGGLIYNTQFSTTDFGDAHDRQYTFEVSNSSIGQLEFIHGIPADLFLNPTNPDTPLILMTHKHFKIEYFFKKYPKGKIVIIETEQKYLTRIIVNLYLKVSFPAISGKNVRGAVIEAKIRSTLPFLKKVDLNKISIEEIQKAVEFTEKNIYDGNKKYQFFNDNITKYNINDRIIILPYGQLIFNEQCTLDKLSQFTAREINDNIRNSYKNYLAKQIKLINKYAPWLIEKEANQ